jgi:hypothetical protein
MSGFGVIPGFWGAKATLTSPRFAHQARPGSECTTTQIACT